MTLQRLTSFAIAATALALLVSGCAGTKTNEVPPQVDLTKWPVIGIVNFSAASHAELSAPATQKFMMQMQRALSRGGVFSN